MKRELKVRIRRWQFLVGFGIMIAVIFLMADHTYRNNGIIIPLSPVRGMHPVPSVNTKKMAFDSLLMARPGLLDSIRNLINNHHR